MQVDANNSSNAGNKDGKGKKGGRKLKRTVTVRDNNAFSTYLFRVLKTTKPDLGISKNAMGQLNQIIADQFENIMGEARKLMIFSKRQTLSSKEIESAVRLLFPGELGKHAVQQGRLALAKHAENSH
jgi:histone H2B